MTYRSNDWVKLVSLAILSLILASCGAGRTTVSGSKASTTLQDDIIKYGRQYLGKPYRYAGKGPNSFDCSGYTSFIFRKFGYRLDPSSAGQDRQIPTIARREELRKGDLVFFEGNGKNGRVGHVGIVTEAFSNGQFKFIHSSTTSGVIISSSTEPYYASRYLRGGRVLEENASYVTRRNPLPDKKQYAVYPAATNSKPDIPEVVPPKKEEIPPYMSSTAAARQTENPSGNGDGLVILVQADPQKNPPLLTNHQPSTNGRQKKDTLRTNRDMALRDESSAVPAPPKSHTVKMGETLYSISRQYGCSVEQLKEWNPQVGTLLQTGEKLRIFVR